MKKISLIFFGSVLFLFVFAISGIAQNIPTVELKSDESYHCREAENPSIYHLKFEALFSGKPPFNAWVQIIDVTANMVMYDEKKIDNWQENFYFGTIPVDFSKYSDSYPKKLSLKITKFKDNSVLDEEYWLTEGISGEVIINVYKIPGIPHAVEIQSYETYHCIEAVNPTYYDINFVAIFSGEPPYEMVVKVIDIETGMQIANPRIVNIRDNNYYSGSIRVSFKIYPNVKKLRLSIVQFRDKNVPVYEPDLTENIFGEVIINMYKTPTPSFENEIITSCSESVEIKAIPGIYGETYKWNIEGDTGSLSADNEETTVFTAPPSENYYTLWFKQTNGECSTEIPVKVKISGLPKAEISSDSKVCGEGDAIIKFDFKNTTAPHFPFQVKYSDGINIFEEKITSLVDSIKHFVSGTNTFNFISVEDALGCFALENDLTGSALIKDIKPFVFAGQDTVICGNKIKLSANQPKEGEFGSWDSQIGEIKEINDFDAEFFTKEYGNFNVTWTITVKEHNCSASKSVNVTFLEIPKAFAGNDTVIYSNSIVLNAGKPEPFTGLWEVLNGNCKIENPLLNNSTARGLTKGETILLWTVTNNICSDNDTITILYNDMRFPTAFSPNGDGKNDTFVILGASEVKNNTFIVFDKNGNVIYKENDYGKNGKFWDGKINGNLVPDGMYSYVFYGDGLKTVKKFLLIKRK